jgi:hypothetical protein
VSTRVDRIANREERTMFTELTEELLDLEAATKGYGAAVYAATDAGGACTSSCSTVILCCTCTTICW